ncbi:MAG: CooT family nickel-binding protein [Candidatus Hydrogenedentes bacterium]|nr:CooT family nickel-binding protein [Candidatus Hydrogenedentota bacterium]
MCLADVYLTDRQQTGTDELVLADVAYIECEQDSVFISTLLGETKIVQAEIRAVDFMKNTVTLRTKDNGNNG